MVQGINWNNYSPNQIVEMKQNGFKVPDDVYNKAETTLSETETKEVTSESADEKDVEYAVTDDAQAIDASEYESKIQDAAEFKKQLEEEGASLKSMVKQFTAKTNESIQIMNVSLEEISQFSDLILEKQDAATETQTQAEEEQAEVQKTVEEMNAEVEKKQTELETVNDKIESGEATEDDVAKAEVLQGEIGDVIAAGTAEIETKATVAEDLTTETTETMSELELLGKITNISYKEAQKGTELSKETFDLSKKLYNKGAKAGKIAATLGSLAGGIAGYFGGKAAGTAIANKGIENYSKKTGIGAATAGKLGEQIAANETNASTKILAGQIGGVVAGASIGASLGSLFGSQNRKIGKAGMNAANQLSQVSANQMNTAQNVANNNGMAINVTTDASTVVSDLSDTINSADKDVTDKAEVKVAEAPESTNTNPSAVDETNVDDENKKKKEA